MQPPCTNSVKKVNSKEAINGVKLNSGPPKKKKNAVLVTYVADKTIYIYLIAGLFSNIGWARAGDEIGPPHAKSVL